MKAFWIRAELEDAAFRGDEFAALGPAARGLLETAGLLKRSEDLQAVECDACGMPHLETVEIITEPHGSKARAYIYCPEAGRVPVAPERMQVWAIDCDRLAHLASSALGLGSRIVQLAADRLWLLGTAKFVDRTRDVFLVRGLTWPDSLQLLAGNARLSTSPCPLILCMNRVADDAEWQDHERVILSLAEFDWLQGDHAVLLAKVTEILREHPRPPTDAGTLSTREEGNKVSRSIGSPAAVKSLLALKDRKGWTVEQLSIEVGTTARTLQNFFKTSKVRSSVFRTMAERLGTSTEGLLNGEFPDRRD